MCLLETMETTTERMGWIRGDLIGAGAFGKVNLALNKENGELFAVKSIECNDRNKSEVDAILNEVEILSSLDSPHVVKCLGSSYTVENGACLHNVFVEYMSGGSLADLMKKFGGRFDETLIRKYTRSILEGMHYLHGRDIVHCDIKGKNVLVGSSGVKLADFGAAKRIVDSGVTMKGTPLWMAPEVVNLSEQGPASDIWSLGCTVLEMATGKAPWMNVANGAANPFVALYHIHRSEQPLELPSCLSEQAHDFLRKCFQKDPRARPTAEDLLQHPFITENFHEAKGKECSAQASPTSVMNFTAAYDSSVENSVPILRSPLFTKRSPHAAPREDAKLTTSSDRWGNFPMGPPPGQWIVLRSPKTSTPSSRTEASQKEVEIGVSKLEAPNASVVATLEEEVVDFEIGLPASNTLNQEEEIEVNRMSQGPQSDDSEVVVEGTADCIEEDARDCMMSITHCEVEARSSVERSGYSQLTSTRFPGRMIGTFCPRALRATAASSVWRRATRRRGFRRSRRRNRAHAQRMVRLKSPLNPGVLCLQGPFSSLETLPWWGLYSNLRGFAQTSLYSKTRAHPGAQGRANEACTAVTSETPCISMKLFLLLKMFDVVFHLVDEEQMFVLYSASFPSCG